MKILKWILIVLLTLGLIGFISYLLLDEDLPQGKQGEKAENLANKMLKAVNDSAWHKIDIVKWNLTEGRKLIWEKDNHWAKVSWQDNDVYIKLDSKTGRVYQNGQQVEESTEKLLNEAYSIWANDSFWLNPITKVKDPGTERRYIEMQDENLEGLLVTYTSGGVTPGDSYLWVIDKETALPKYVKMWVQIIPLGGIKFSWEDWHTTPGGAKIAQKHESIFTLEINNLETWLSKDDFPQQNEFEFLEEIN